MNAPSERKPKSTPHTLEPPAWFLTIIAATIPRVSWEVRWPLQYTEPLQLHLPNAVIQPPSRLQVSMFTFTKITVIGDQMDNPKSLQQRLDDALPENDLIFSALDREQVGDRKLTRATFIPRQTASK